MTSIKTFLAIILLAIFSSSCSTDESKTSTFWVNSMKTECDAGAGKAQCLQIYKGEDLANAEWTYFYSAIEGFTFEPGLLQHIEVSETQLDPENVPADASSIAYKLIEVLEKKEDPRMLLNDIWAATHINSQTFETNKIQTPTLEINISKMMIMGTDGCNSFSGSIKSLGENTIEFGPIAMTRKMCPEMEIPDAYGKALSNSISYKRDDLTLFFFDANNNEILRFKKAD